MRLNHYHVCLLFALTVFAGCDNDDPPAGDVVVTTQSGPVRGVLEEDYRVFRGIPYAQPPVGDLRFRSPQPAQPWTAELNATEFGARCPQIASDFFPATTTMDEDCLTLNVWTPYPIPEESVPVMVWIHGGGFMYDTASATVYDAQNLTRQGVVVVTFDYRLGPLGFLAHEALTQEDPDYESSGNYGLEDQRLVLEWVRDNIAAFGGNPESVTIFGESAGSSSVCLHMVMPSSQGLFHRAMLQSGICGTQPDIEVPEAQGQELAAAVGCDSDIPNCLRSLPVDDIINALPQDPTILLGEGASWGPNIDGEVIPSSPMMAVLMGDVAEVPIVIGANSDEGTPFVALAEQIGGALTEDDYTNFVNGLAANFGADPQDIIDEYPLADFDSPSDAVSRIITDGMFVCSTRTMTRLLENDDNPIYLYHFAGEFELPGYPGLGAFHTAELPFLFQSTYMGGTLTQAQMPLSDAMVGYWTRFAITGDPNGEGQPTWPAYTLKADEHLLFDAEITTGSGLRSDKCDFWFSLFI